MINTILFTGKWHNSGANKFMIFNNKIICNIVNKKKSNTITYIHFISLKQHMNFDIKRRFNSSIGFNCKAKYPSVETLKILFNEILLSDSFACYHLSRKKHVWYQLEYNWTYFAYMNSCINIITNNTSFTNTQTIN